MAVIKKYQYFQGSMGVNFRKISALFALSLIFSATYGTFAFAQDVNAVAQDIVASSEQLPGLIAAISYLLGILFGVLGVLKLKDHVENPTQTTLRSGLIRLLAGGALFALPIIYEAVANTIGYNSTTSFDNATAANSMSAFIGGTLGAVGIDFNVVLGNIRDSISEVPALISAVAYLLGLIIAVQAIIKTKEHVDNPDQTALKEPVIRFLIAGALLSIPTIYDAMFETVANGGVGLFGGITSLLGGFSFLSSSYAGTACNPATALVAPLVGSASLGTRLCSIFLHAGAFPAFLTAVAYLIGLIFGIWGILKIRDHVLNPQQTAISEGIMRLLAGGAFFALPIMVEVLRASIGSGLLTASAIAPVSGYNNGTGGFLAGLLASLLGGGGCTGAGPLGLDGILMCFMNDVMGPLHVVLNFFAFCAGIILLMIGISRLIKTAQDGPRGPGGLGTVATFVAAGALIAYNEMVRAVSATIGGSNLFGQTATFATIGYDVCGGGVGSTCAESDAAHATISAILQFVIIVGLISFVRGIFIMRAVAEGNQQASIMAGVTHIVGGAVAVNLGPLLNAVQTTLGIGGFGIAFT